MKFLNREGTRVQVEMGRLSFDGKDVGMVTGNQTVNKPLRFGDEEYLCTCVSIGNPHCVIPMEEISREKICRIGRYSERSEYFQAGINTQIVKVMDKNNLEIEIFERGVGYTLASGTSSCAAAGVAYKLGLTDSDVMVHMPGGKLWIQIDEEWNVMMTGNVQRVCSIELAEEYSKMLT